MPRIKRPKSASTPRRPTSLLLGTLGPHTDDGARLTLANAFTGAYTSSTAKLHTYRRQLFGMPPERPEVFWQRPLLSGAILAGLTPSRRHRHPRGWTPSRRWRQREEESVEASPRRNALPNPRRDRRRSHSVDAGVGWWMSGGMWQRRLLLGRKNTRRIRSSIGIFSASRFFVVYDLLTQLQSSYWRTVPALALILTMQDTVEGRQN